MIALAMRRRGVMGGADGNPLPPARADAIRILFEQAPNHSRASVVVVTYMVVTAMLYSPWPHAIGWGVAAGTVSLARFMLGYRFRRLAPPDEALVGWARRYTLANLVSGCVWGLSFVLFAHFDQPISVALTMCCLYSITAGSVPSHAYWPPSLYAIVVPVFSAVLIKCILAFSLGWALMGIASALYGVTMIGYCRTQARTLDESFRIRFENVALVDALQVEKATAEQASLAKSQFLAAASHDLRQPLYALGLFSSSLEELQLDREGRDVVRRIQDSIGVMESSFEGLLDLSKLEAGVVMPRPEPVDIDALFDRIGQVFGPVAQERGLDLRFRSDGEWVLSDPPLLEQVTSNLVSNAIRATTRGGVLLAARRRDESVRFEIWDTGRGIAPDDIARIFDDYVQLDNPERDRRRGLGLGLAIARRSVGLLGARIDVASRLGRGSRFGFAQPLCTPAAVAAAERPTLLAPLLRRRADLPILLVEDDEDVRAALSDLLARWGFEFRAVPHAEAALEALAAGVRYGLVITDQRLSGTLSGLALIRAMRARMPDPPPAIIITGEVDSPLLRAAAADGVIILHKPVPAQRLRELLGDPPMAAAAARAAAG